MCVCVLDASVYRLVGLDAGKMDESDLRVEISQAHQYSLSPSCCCLESLIFSSLHKTHYHFLQEPAAMFRPSAITCISSACPLRCLILPNSHPRCGWECALVAASPLALPHPRAVSLPHSDKLCHLCITLCLISSCIVALHIKARLKAWAPTASSAQAGCLVPARPRRKAERGGARR